MKQVTIAGRAFAALAVLAVIAGLIFIAADLKNSPEIICFEIMIGSLVIFLCYHVVLTAKDYFHGVPIPVTGLDLGTYIVYYVVQSGPYYLLYLEAKGDKLNKLIDGEKLRFVRIPINAVTVIEGIRCNLLEIYKSDNIVVYKLATSFPIAQQFCS